MKCKHSKDIETCKTCKTKLVGQLISRSCDCFANMFIRLANADTVVIRTFGDELLTDTCLSIPLTTTCDGTSFQLGNCSSPQGKWCKIVDRGNGFITSLQVPKGCSGCYNFDLSASVGLTAIIQLTSNFVVFELSLPATFTLKLSEQLPRDDCVADEIVDDPSSCFTSTIFPIIDTATVTASYSSIFGLVSELFAFPNFIATSVALQKKIKTLSCSGIVCLKDCQRLVPSLSIAAFDIRQLSSIIQFIGTLGPVTYNLHLADLSLKLNRIGDCTNCTDCTKTS